MFCEHRIDQYYFVDIYIPSLSLCVEVDGIHHYHGIDHQMRKRYQVKERVLNKLGVQVVRMDLAQYMRKSDVNKKRQMVEELLQIANRRNA
jgi:very-short-patch-repair endonuclease